MFEVLFFDVNDGVIKRAYAVDLDSIFCILECYNVDYENHFVKVSFIKK